MLRHWALTFLGNLAGALFIVGIIIGHGGVLSSDLYAAEALKIATAKVVTPAWYQIFLRAIGANWLVCLACFLACCAREFFSKVVAIWYVLVLLPSMRDKMLIVTLGGRSSLSCFWD